MKKVRKDVIYFSYVWQIIKLPSGPGARPHGYDLQACFSAEQESRALVITVLSVAFAIV